MTVSVSNVDLMERVCRLKNKIYREMFSKTFMSCFASHKRILQVVLSSDLPAWISVEGRIPYSFSNFITTPELSGPSGFYISPGIYHTQITEYFLEKIYR